MITINGTKLPNPTKYHISMSDLDSSSATRNEAGVLIRNRVRQGVTKIELGFTLKGETLATVLNLIKPDKVKVEYYDPRNFEPRTIQAYVGDRSCNVISYDPHKYVKDIWWEVTFNLIEY